MKKSQVKQEREASPPPLSYAKQQKHLLAISVNGAPPASKGLKIHHACLYSKNMLNDRKINDFL